MHQYASASFDGVAGTLLPLPSLANTVIYSQLVRLSKTYPNVDPGSFGQRAQIQKMQAAGILHL